MFTHEDRLLLRSVEAKLAALIRLTLAERRNEMKTLADIASAQVAEHDALVNLVTVDDSIVALVNSQSKTISDLAAQVAALKVPDPAAQAQIDQLATDMQALADQTKAEADKVRANVLANTPADPNAATGTAAADTGGAGGAPGAGGGAGDGAGAGGAAAGTVDGAGSGA